MERKGFKKKPKRLKAVLFDYDGVIANTIEDNFRAWQYAFSRQGVFLSREEFVSYEGMRPLELVRAVCQNYGLVKAKEEDIVLEKENYFVKHAVLHLYDGVEDLLEKLRRNNIKRGLVSVGSKVRILEKTPKRILSLFNAIVTGEEVEKPKPDPEPYKKALAKLRVSHLASLAVEDSPLGIQSAKAAGIYCIAIASTRPKEFLQAADIIVNSISEIARIVVGKPSRNVAKKLIE